MLFDRRWRQRIERRLEVNEQATADLRAALTRVQASAAATAADVRTLAAQVAAGQAGDDSAQIEDAVAKLNAVADTLDAAATPGTTTTTTAEPAPAAPAPDTTNASAAA